MRTIVLGTDGSAGARSATAWVAANAGLLGAEVVAVHSIDLGVVPPPTVPGPVFVVDDTVRAAARERLHDWCAPLRDAGLVVHEELFEGDPATAITRVARERAADLVVVGRRGHGGLAEVVLGSVAHRLAHRADVPVVVVPDRPVSAPERGPAGRRRRRRPASGARDPASPTGSTRSS